VNNIKTEKRSFLKVLGFRRKFAMVKTFRCSLCAEWVNKKEFRNEVFMKEFESSWLCQECQDTVFGYKIAW
jgi:hypothetical protein